MFAQVPVVANSATKITPGSSCKVLNQKAIYLGKTYTCIKSGKKMIWNKGVAVKASPSAGVAITEPQEIRNFQDAVDRPKDVAYWAWKKSSQQIVSNKSSAPKVELIVGPNTKLSNPKPELSFEAVTRLYSQFKQPNKVIAIYYSFKDVEWAQKQYQAVIKEASGQEAKNSCQSIDFCWGASGTINQAGDGVILAAVMTTEPNLNHTSGTLEAHEYTHVLQISNFYGTSNQMQAMCCLKAFTPWWFAEGGAEFSQFAAMYSASFANFIENRKSVINDFLANRDKKYTEEWIAYFIKPKDNSIWMAQETQWHLYDLGALISEIFTAINGPSINIQIYKDISEGMTYEASFAKNFGISWESAIPLIAKSISGLVEK